MAEEETLIIKKDFLLKIIIAVLAVLFVTSLFTGGFGISGNTINGDDAGTEVVAYLNSLTGGGVEYVDYQDLGNLYEITVSYQDQDVPIYVTKDGNYLAQGVVPITEELANNTEDLNTPIEETPETNSSL
jgi:hypothetical protein